MIDAIIYFGLGILTDILVTLYYISVGHRLAIRSAVLSLLMTLLGFFIIERIVVSTNWFLILSYALGSAIGCYSVIKLSKSKFT